MDLPKPAHVSELVPRRRWVRSLASALAVALAFIAGDLVAAFLPGAALGFESATSGLRGKIGASMPPLALASVAVGIAVVACLLLVWLAGKPLQRGYLIPALFLGLGAALAGFNPVGREIGAERDIVALEGQVASLKAEDGRVRAKLATAEAAAARAGGVQKALEDQNKAAAEASEAATRKLAEKDQSMARAAERQEQKVREQSTRAQEAEAARDKSAVERDKAAGERDKAIADVKKLRRDLLVEQKDHDYLVDSLRKEIADLKKKLEEKKQRHTD